MTDHSHNVQENANLFSRKFNIFFTGLIFLFWVGQFLTTPYSRVDIYPYMRIIDSYFSDSEVFGFKGITLNEMVIYALICYIFLSFRKYYVKDSFFWWFFWISFAMVLISFLNPNNKLTSIKYLITDEPRRFILYLILLFVFGFLRKDILAMVLRRFFVVGAYLAGILSIIWLGTFLLGFGVFFLYSKATLPHAEILNWFIVFQIFFLFLFFKTTRYRYLFLTLVLFIMIFFGDRRTPNMVMIMSNVAFIAYCYRLSIIRILKIILITVLLAGIFFSVLKKININTDYFMNRVTGVLVNENKETNQVKYYDDEGHLTQTLTTFGTMLANLDRFWGGGFRNVMFPVEGQTAYIHNNFVVVWALYGLHLTLFLALCFLIIGQRILNMFFKARSYVNVIKTGIFIVFFFLIIGDAFTGEYFLKHVVYIPAFVLMLVTIKLDESCDKFLYTDRVFPKFSY